MDDQTETIEMETVAVLKHRRASRWMHWINFPLITIMIYSGLRIYWADVRDPFGFGVGLVGWHWFNFIPEINLGRFLSIDVNESLNIERKLAKGMAFHFTFGWLFVINGLAYALYTWRSGEWRHLLPDRHSAKDSIEVVKHDLFIRTKPLPPQGRYNGAQRWSYSIIIALGGVAMLTGLAIYKPTQLNLLTSLFGGYEMARTIHFATTITFLAFFVIHILQVARAGWKNFISMVTGYELVTRPLKKARITAPSATPNNDAPTPDQGEEELTNV